MDKRDLESKILGDMIAELYFLGLEKKDKEISKTVEAAQSEIAHLQRLLLKENK